MQSTSHFVWSGDPIFFELGPFTLPFAVNGIAFLVGIFAYFFLVDYATGPNDPKKRKRGTEAEKNLPWWLHVGYLLACIIGTQLLFRMFPVEFSPILGPLSVRWYGVLFALAFVVGYMIGLKEFADSGVPRERLETLITYVIIATVAGARLGHVIFYEPGYYIDHLWEVPMVWKGGLASHGAAIGIFISLILYTRKYKDMNLWWVVDRVVIPVSIGGAFVRLGNFFNSEILGKPTDFSLAIIFAQEDLLPRHPTMLYESAIYISLFVFLWAIYKRFQGRPPEGLIFGVFLIYMFTGRFLIEFTKSSQAAFDATWPISMGQWLSVPFVFAGIYMLVKKVDWNKTAELKQ